MCQSDVCKILMPLTVDQGSDIHALPSSMSDPSCIIRTMNVLTALVALAALVLGAVLGWLAHASRNGDRLARAEALLEAHQGGEQTLLNSLNAVNADSAQRQAGAMGAQMTHIVGPLRDAVGTLAKQVEAIERERVHAYAGLTEQVAGMRRTSQELSAQTTQLVSALRSPQIRGRWGELQLERVVELAGMTRHCDFDTQVSGDSAEGVPTVKVRPDMVVRLAGGRQIVVDAKVPFNAYLDALSADRAQDKEQLLFRHAAQLRSHVEQLAAKSYWQSFDPTPEFVVLFVPGDPFLDAALSTDPGLLEYAFGKNVVLTTPTTLIALLRTVALTWRQEAFSRDAAAIHKLGKELYQRLDTMARHMDRAGSHLGKAVDAFNATAASMESRVMVTARKLSELEVSHEQPAEVRRVDDAPRHLSAASTRGDAASTNATPLANTANLEG